MRNTIIDLLAGGLAAILLLFFLWGMMRIFR